MKLDVRSLPAIVRGCSSGHSATLSSSPKRDLDGSAGVSTRPPKALRTARSLVWECYLAALHRFANLRAVRIPRSDRSASSWWPSGVAEPEASLNSARTG